MSFRSHQYLVYIGLLFPHKIMLQSDPPPFDWRFGDIQWQIVAICLEIAQRSQMKAYRKPPSLSNGTKADPYD